MENESRDMNKMWREIFRDALWVAQKLSLPSANKLQEHLVNINSLTMLQDDSTDSYDKKMASTKK